MLAAPMARLQTKKQAAVTTGSAENNRHSLRDGLHAYTQSPWCAGLVGHHARQCLRIARDTSIGVSGRCDFTSTVPPFVGAPEDALRQTAAIASPPRVS
ncbi:hypothetical protein [Bradyrhizobium sp. HKCCYLR20261]|uniref:hypothetical protein n=1 Tax=Bradyrhizobium sp. HKCCYLR20261 TaxID=3420760 RepID=UPI003EB94773